VQDDDGTFRYEMPEDQEIHEVDESEIAHWFEESQNQAVAEAVAAAEAVARKPVEQAGFGGAPRTPSTPSTPPSTPEAPSNYLESGSIEPGPAQPPQPGPGEPGPGQPPQPGPAEPPTRPSEPGPQHPPAPPAPGTEPPVPPEPQPPAPGGVQLPKRRPDDPDHAD